MISLWKETQCVVQAPSLPLPPLVVMGWLYWRTKHIVYPEISSHLQVPSLPLPPLLVEMGNRTMMESVNDLIDI